MTAGAGDALDMKHQGANNVSIPTRPRVALAALVVAAFALPAYAQQAAPAKPAAPAAAPADPTPSHVVVARDVIFASGISRTFESMVSQALDQYKASVLQAQPNLRAEIETVIAEVDAKTRANEVANMQISAAILLARRMSEQELKDTLAFFTSASGKKYVETQPRFLDDLVPAIDGWAARTLPAAVDQVRAIMNQKGHKL